MIYVLIIISSFGGSGSSGQMITVQEYNNLNNCQLAKEFVLQNGYSRVKAECFPK